MALALESIGHNPPNTPARLHAQATELEGVFLNTLMKEMFATIGKNSEFGGSFAEETWRGMQAEQMANALASAGGIGLADALMPDLLAIQERAAGPGPSFSQAGAYR